MANIKYAGMEAVSRIADYVNAKLTFVSTMPESPDINTIVLYVGADTSAYKQGGVYKYDGTDWVLINLVKAIELTQEEYNALPLAVQCNGTIYFVTNAHVEGSIVTGYYNSADGKFYIESTFETPMADNVNVIYIDAPTNITYIYDLTNDEYVQVGGGGGGTVIEYVNSLPVSGIQDIIYGYDSVTTYNETVANDFLDNDDNFVKTDESGNYIYTAAADINMEASVDGITYKGFASLAFDNSNEEFILTYSDTTTATLQLSETFYWKISARNYYAGNADEQSLTLLAGGSGGSGTSYAAGNAINITGNVISGDYKAGNGIAIDGDEISTTEFVGTRSEWDALPAADKAKYDKILITDDQTQLDANPGHEIFDGAIAKVQREGLKFVGFDISDDSVGNKTVIEEIPYTAGDGIEITNKEVSVDETRPSTFVGTVQEWEGLTTAEKAQYTLVNLTNDPVVGPQVVVDTVESGNLNPVTSNAVYGALALKANLTQISNPNLLDNAWFTINQRGSSSYTGNAYCVDRWKVGNGASLTIENDGLTLSTTGEIKIYQFLENSLINNIAGKVVTISFILDGILYKGTGTLPRNTSGAYEGFDTVAVMPNGDTLTIDIYASATSLKYLRCWSLTTWQTTHTISAIKLELGTVSTLAMDIAPNYATELLKCQRYFVFYEDLRSSGDITSASKQYRICVFTPVAMRVKPTWDFSNSTIIVRTPTGYSNYTGSSMHAVTAGQVNIMSGNCLMLSDNISTSVDDPNNVVTSVQVTNVSLSADL